MAQHGPPMTPGQAMGGQPGMHMGHPGGPNGPQVTQGGPMMAGMQPGMGPGGAGMGGPGMVGQGPMSNHALSHLQPGNPMFQQNIAHQQSMYSFRLASDR
jgi:hypothetical protein